MNSALMKVIPGQILLVLCCVFYLIWWSISYRPDVSVSRVGGINGILLLITAALGLVGLALTIYGINTLPAVSRPKLNGLWICLAGIAAYFILLFLTRFLFNRPVTTELVLITGWTVLELTAVNALNAAGYQSDRRFFVCCAVIAAAFLVSMILYVLYYRMKPVPAFYAAMVPLITEGVSMVVIIFMTIL